MKTFSGSTTSVLLSLLALAKYTSSFCLYRGPDCMPSGDPTCQTFLRNYSDPKDLEPSSDPVPDDLKGICPDFENGPRCCDANTLKILKFNFQFLLDPTFGSADQGCSICSANLKRFWCQYNCAPSQSEFTPVSSISQYNYTVNPNDPDSWRLVTESDVYLDINTTCLIFGSCKNVDFAKSLGSMSSYQGLFNVFSANAVTQGNVIMNFKYVSQPGSLTSLVNNCSQIFDTGFDQYNYSLYQGQGWCNCQHCASNCSAVDFSQYIQTRGLMNGFKVSTLVLTIVIATIIIAVGILVRLATTGSIFSSTAGEQAYHEEQDGQVGSTMGTAQ